MHTGARCVRNDRTSGYETRRHHVNTLSLSLSLSHTHTIFPSHSLSLSHTRTRTHTHTSTQGAREDGPDWHQTQRHHLNTLSHTHAHAHTGAREVLEKMDQVGIKPIVATLIVLLSLSHTRTHLFFSPLSLSLSLPHTHTRTQAREVLEKMDQVGIKPNVTTYNGVISACARAAGGKVEILKTQLST